MREKDEFVKDVGILDDNFTCRVHVSLHGETALEIVDNGTGEEYTLAYVRDSVGAFVGSVRQACEEILTDVVERCFEWNIFKTAQARLVTEYAKEKYGTKTEFPFEEDLTAVLREGKTRKWYAILMTVKSGRLGINDGGMVEIMNVKAPPERVAELLKTEGYYPAYHMNKKHWYTMRLDGILPIEEIYKRIDESYLSVVKKSYIRKNVDKSVNPPRRHLEGQEKRAPWNPPNVVRQAARSFISFRMAARRAFFSTTSFRGARETRPVESPKRSPTSREILHFIQDDSAASVFFDNVIQRGKRNAPRRNPTKRSSTDFVWGISPFSQARQSK